MTHRNEKHSHVPDAASQTSIATMLIAHKKHMTESRSAALISKQVESNKPKTCMISLLLSYAARDRWLPSIS